MWSNLCTYQVWALGSWHGLKDISRRPLPSVCTCQVWALGSWHGLKAKSRRPLPSVCTYQVWPLGSWHGLKAKSRRPLPSVCTYQVWALGSWLGVPHFSMVKSWGPLLPYSSANPFIGTRDVPVTNCSSLDLISLLKEYTACTANDKSFVRICKYICHNKTTGLCFLQSNCKNYIDLHMSHYNLARY